MGTPALQVDRTTLHLMSWNRQVGVCIEGVSDHAHQIESVLHLLPKRSFVDAVDD
jgi:hypothetical protein